MKVGWRLWLLVIVLALSVLAIKPSFESGVLVKSVERDSIAFKAGLRTGDIIKSVNGNPVRDTEDYASLLREYENVKEKRIDITTKGDSFTFLADGIPEISIGEISKTNVQTGLDLRGGARALIKPYEKITDEQLQDLIEVSRNRFNVYGLKDVQIRSVSDLEGNKFMLIEVAGAAPSDLEDLVSKQGKFEAKISNQTVFEGGKDISDVCRKDATCAAVTECFTTQGENYACRFRFTIYLKEQAAEKHADATGNLTLDETGEYLSEKLYLYVDEKEVDSLLISADLKGRVTTQISVQGTGVGETREDAFNDAKESMNHLQTILITGSLPYKLEIAKLDTISPNLGSEFTRLIFMAGGISIALVGLIIFIRYRKFKASLALLFTSFSELVIILGVAAFIKWNLDLPSIAGILATIGTGVDQQIVILDEAEKGLQVSLRERMKRAFFIIGTAYATTVASLIPLYWAGAGLFKGFAFTTIIGITAGVLITRPAFAEIIKKIKS